MPELSENEIKQLAAFLQASSIEKVFSELWQTASPGLRQQFADAVITHAMAGFTDPYRGSGRALCAALDSDLRVLVAGVLEEQRTAIIARLSQQLENELAAEARKYVAPGYYDDLVAEAAKLVVEKARKAEQAAKQTRQRP